jgi:hypothetical protein
MPPRFRLHLACALLVATVTPGCGEDSLEPAREIYQLTADQTNTETLPDGAVRHTFAVHVSQGNFNVAGAWMRFEVSHGSVTPQTDRSDGSGNGRVEWTFDAEDLVGLSAATLSGCAQNVAPPDCPSEVLATLTFD